MATRRKVVKPEGERVRSITDDVRKRFLEYLTVNSSHNDARRKDFNQALFDKDEGFAVWERTDLSMVMGKLDRAINDVLKERT